MKILVIGGSGFIGTRLVAQLLERGHQVRILDKAPSADFPARVTLGDVRDAAALCAAVAGQEIVVNLAAEHRDDVEPISLYDEVNVGGARHLVDALARHGVGQLLFVSSSAVYGIHQPLAHEQSPLRPENAYGRSKVAAEAIYRAWAEPSGRALAVIRPTVVFGAGNAGNVDRLLRQIRARRFVMVGPGDNRKSLAYVDNLVAFMIGLLPLHSGSLIANYADKPDLCMSELVEIAYREFHDRRAPRWFVPEPLALPLSGLTTWLMRRLGRPFAPTPDRLRKFTADTRIADHELRRLGFQAPISLVDGLRSTIRTMRLDTK